MDRKLDLIELTENEMENVVGGDCYLNYCDIYWGSGGLYMSCNYTCYG